MSRTHKGQKGIGTDFWSRRPYSGESATTLYKRFTIRKERTQERQSLHRNRQQALDKDV